ncbi:MAG: HU family DNA-binding protein [Maioricimonas sp. JB049]
MTKKEIVKAISESCGLTQLKTKEIVQQTFEAIIDTLVEDPRHRIELRNFGVFEVKKRAARKARNPRTGERVDVAEKYVVTFKPGKEMEERVLQLEKLELNQPKEPEPQQAQPQQPTQPQPTQSTHVESSTPAAPAQPVVPQPSAPQSIPPQPSQLGTPGGPAQPMSDPVSSTKHSN